MPKNKGKGGKNRRRGKNENESEKRELIFKEDEQEYAQVTKMLGNGRLEAMCFDGVKRLCHIRGKLRKKVSIRGTFSSPNCSSNQIQKRRPKAIRKTAFFLFVARLCSMHVRELISHLCVYWFTRHTPCKAARNVRLLVCSSRQHWTHLISRYNNNNRYQ